jgi:hypothetical protein
VRTTPAKEYVHEAQFVAEVDVTLIEDDHAWAPGETPEEILRQHPMLEPEDIPACLAFGSCCWSI